MKKVVYSKGLGKLSLLEIVGRIDRTNVGTKKSVPCYIVDNYAIVQSSIACSHYAVQDKVIESIHSLADNGVNVVRLYGYVSDESDRRDYRTESYCSALFVMDRAPGEELYRGVTYGYSHTEPEDVASLLSYMDMLGKVPQEHYTKYVHDYLAILRSGVAVDPSKKGNFFYDSSVGFTFIDVRNENHDVSSRFLVQNMMSVVQPYLLTKEICQDTSTLRQYDRLTAEILIKMDTALLANGFSREDIDECFRERYYSDGLHASAMRFGNFESIADAREVLDTDSTM